MTFVDTTAVPDEEAFETIQREYVGLGASLLEAGPAGSTRRSGTSPVISSTAQLTWDAPGGRCHSEFVDTDLAEPSPFFGFCDSADLSGFFPPSESAAAWDVPIDALQQLFSAGGELHAFDENGARLMGPEYYGVVRTLEGSIRASLGGRRALGDQKVREIRLEGELIGRYSRQGEPTYISVMGYPQKATAETRARIAARIQGTLLWDASRRGPVQLSINGSVEIIEVSTATLVVRDRISTETWREWEGALLLRAKLDHLERRLSCVTTPFDWDVDGLPESRSVRREGLAECPSVACSVAARDREAPRR